MVALGEDGDGIKPPQADGLLPLFTVKLCPDRGDGLGSMKIQMYLPSRKSLHRHCSKRVIVSRMISILGEKTRSASRLTETGYEATRHALLLFFPLDNFIHRGGDGIKTGGGNFGLLDRTANVYVHQFMHRRLD